MKWMSFEKSVDGCVVAASESWSSHSPLRALLHNHGGAAPPLPRRHPKLHVAAQMPITAYHFAMLADHVRNAAYRTAYPAMAALDGYISMPLLGNCSERPSCAPGPWANEMANNVAINASERGQAFGLPDDAQFASARFRASDNRGYNGSAASLGFMSDDPWSSHCWQLTTVSPLLQGHGFRRIHVEGIGPPAWRARFPCAD